MYSYFLDSTLEHLNSDIPRLYFHAFVEHMKLNADFAIHFPIGLIVVHHDAHHVPVDQLDERIATRDDIEVVPVVAPDKPFQLI